VKLLVKLAMVREVEDERCGESHHALGNLQLQQLGRRCSMERDRAWGASMLEEEDGVLGFFSSNSGEVVGAVMMQHVAGVVLRTGVVPFSSSSSPPPASFFLPLLLLSFFSVLVLLVVRMEERERT
jgi:hypothetical protein